MGCWGGDLDGVAVVGLPVRGDDEESFGLHRVCDLVAKILQGGVGGVREVFDEVGAAGRVSETRGEIHGLYHRLTRGRRSRLGCEALWMLWVLCTAEPF